MLKLQKSITLTYFGISHRIIPQPKDGDCFYSSVTYHLPGEWTAHQLRMVVSRHIDQDETTPLLGDMIRKGRWADNEDLFAVTEVIPNCVIVVVDDNRHNLIQVGDMSAYHMFVVRLWNEHYDAVELCAATDEDKIRKLLRSTISVQARILPYELMFKVIVGVFTFLIVMSLVGTRCARRSLNTF